MCCRPKWKQQRKGETILEQSLMERGFAQERHRRPGAALERRLDGVVDVVGVAADDAAAARGADGAGPPQGEQAETARRRRRRRRRLLLLLLRRRRRRRRRRSRRRRRLGRRRRPPRRRHPRRGQKEEAKPAAYLQRPRGQYRVLPSLPRFLLSFTEFLPSFT